MIRRPPRSTLDRSAAASDVYKRQAPSRPRLAGGRDLADVDGGLDGEKSQGHLAGVGPVSYTHLRAHETVLDLVCRLLLEKKKKKTRPWG